MNAGQKTFYDFVLQRVQPGKEDEMKAVMAESFRKQDEGAFTREYMAQVAPKMMALMRPERVAEFKQAAAHMSGTIK